MEKMNCYLKLSAFEGPFDLLYHLIKKAEVDIWEISVAEITRQYLDFLQELKEFDLEIASEFLVMAATLLRLKSKLLLPVKAVQTEDEEDEQLININSREELLRRLNEYRLFKSAAAYLEQEEDKQRKVFLRSTMKRKTLFVTRQESFIVYPCDTLASVLRVYTEDRVADEESRVVLSDREKISVARLMNEICAKLRDSNGAVSFRYLCGKASKLRIAATFFAVLQLAKQKRVRLWQEKEFSRILVICGSVQEQDEENYRNGE